MGPCKICKGDSVVITGAVIYDELSHEDSFSKRRLSLSEIYTELVPEKSKNRTFDFRARFTESDL